MIISEITLQRHADIYEQLTNRRTHQAGDETFYAGIHPDLENVLIFQNGSSGTATLIELGKFLPGDTD